MCATLMLTTAWRALLTLLALLLFQVVGSGSHNLGSVRATLYFYIPPLFRKGNLQGSLFLPQTHDSYDRKQAGRQSFQPCSDLVVPASVGVACGCSTEEEPSTALSEPHFQQHGFHSLLF